jgi:hypothetical protein
MAEKINITIGSTYFNNVPGCVININNKVVLQQPIGKNVSIEELVDFPLNVEIMLYGKGMQDMRFEDGKIIEDTLLFLHEFRINDVLVTDLLMNDPGNIYYLHPLRGKENYRNAIGDNEAKLIINIVDNPYRWIYNTDK